jgi:hypothetical protein
MATISRSGGGGYGLTVGRLGDDLDPVVVPKSAKAKSNVRRIAINPMAKTPKFGRSISEQASAPQR